MFISFQSTNSNICELMDLIVQYYTLPPEHSDLSIKSISNAGLSSDCWQSTFQPYTRSPRHCLAPCSATRSDRKQRMMHCLCCSIIQSGQSNIAHLCIPTEHMYTYPESTCHIPTENMYIYQQSTCVYTHRIHVYIHTAHAYNPQSTSIHTHTAYIYINTEHMYTYQQRQIC